MASPTRWAWVWVNSRSWWLTGRPGMLWFMGLQRVTHDWATELNWRQKNVPTKRGPHPNSQELWLCPQTSFVVKGLCKCDYVKDMERGRVSWIIQFLITWNLKSQEPFWLWLEGGVITEKWSEMEEGNEQLWNFRYLYKLEKAKKGILC